MSFCGNDAGVDHTQRLPSRVSEGDSDVLHRESSVPYLAHQRDCHHCLSRLSSQVALVSPTAEYLADDRPGFTHPLQPLPYPSGYAWSAGRDSLSPTNWARSS